MLRASVIAASIFAVALFATPADALVLDWTGNTWTANPANQINTNSYESDGTRAGNDVVISTKDNWTELGTPAVNQSLQGGQASLNEALVLTPNMTRDTHSITITISFIAQYPQGVSNVSFSLFDIDKIVGSYTDEVSGISATLTDNSTVAPTVSVGSAVTVGGTASAPVLTGNADSPDTGAGSGNGTATLTFTADHIKSITFTIGEPNPAPNDPDMQTFGISDITYSPVPEMNPTVAAAIACVVAFLAQRRFRRRAS